MSWRLAKSLVKLREQINAAYPERDKSSDGSIGDRAHRRRKSDHNPNEYGVVCAIDIDEDLSPTIHSVEHIVNAIRASKDPRVKYMIYEGRITREGSKLQQWKRYTGPNSHSHHLHVSVYSTPRLADDDSVWNIGSAAVASPAPNKSGAPSDASDVLSETDATSSVGSSSTRMAQSPVLKRGSKNEAVKVLQRRLREIGYRQISVDGIFGPATEKAVQMFQKKHGLVVDGKVGSRTKAKLGI